MDIITDLKIQFSSYYENIIVFFPKLIVAIIVTLVFLYSMRYIKSKLTKYFHKKADDKLLINFIDSVLNISIIIFGFLLFLYIIGQTGIATSILGAAGVSAFIIGFAFKDIAENFLAGVILAFKRPFKLGDVIKSENVEGSIIEMSLRDTHIKTFDGKDVYVPNAQILKNPLFNYTIDGFLRKQFSIKLAYGSDINKARSIIIDSVKKVSGILLDKKSPSTLISSFENEAIIIIVYYWINTFDKSFSGSEIQSQAMNNTLIALSKSNFERPSAQLSIKNENN
ncbi:MAG: mechanosensitive ion channel family protein [Saprospiraceae bacterium]